MTDYACQLFGLSLVLPQLVKHVGSNDLYMRQGSILGIAELIQALSE